MDTVLSPSIDDDHGSTGHAEQCSNSAFIRIQPQIQFLDEQIAASPSPQSPDSALEIAAQGKSCLLCRRSKQKCELLRETDIQCIRCTQKNYRCSMAEKAFEAGEKRPRKLSNIKCAACRKAKQKCEPVDRNWEQRQKCERCISKGLPCSEPQVSSRKRSQHEDTDAAEDRAPEEEDSDPLDNPENVIDDRAQIVSESTPVAPVGVSDHALSGQIGSRVIIKPTSTLRRLFLRLTTVPERPGRIMPNLSQPEPKRQPSAYKNEFKYTAIRENEFRLLQLAPGVKSDMIECSLYSSKEVSQPYEALSYCWGTDDPRYEIQIVHTRKPSGTAGTPGNTPLVVKKDRFFVRSNLHAALKHLREPKTSTLLWVDVICIDQENLEEKSNQVSLIAQIYSNAVNVCVWLGEGDKKSDMAVQFVKSMLVQDWENLDRLTRDVSQLERWHALAEFMKNPWFTRRWVLQEIGLARNATIHYGKAVVQWSDFADSIKLFGGSFEQIKKLSQQSKKPESSVADLGEIRLSGAYLLLEVLSRLLRKLEKGALFEQRYNLEVLVSTLLAFKTSEPRDIIYALLSIAKDTPATSDSTMPKLSSLTAKINLPKVDYGKSVGEVYMDFIAYCVRSSGSLDIICRYWAVGTGTPPQIQAKNQLPSWVPVFSDSSLAAPADYKSGSIAAGDNSLIGHPNKKNYNAAYGKAAIFKFGGVIDRKTSLNSSYDGTLQVKGFVLDRIATLGPRAAQGLILAEGLRMGGWNYDPIDTEVPNTLWRTLVADRDSDGENAPSWYQRACLSCLLYSTTTGDIDTSALITSQEKSTNMLAFLKRVRTVIWNRKFLKSKGEPGVLGEGAELFGLAPTRAREGDLICILLGCSVPVILREHQAEEQQYYEFIGDSYIHGMMEGEALAGKNYHDIGTRGEWFVLR